MMIEGSLVTLGALAWLFLRLGRESELRQQLLEQGVDPRAATRAVRYGRGRRAIRPAVNHVTGRHSALSGRPPRRPRRLLDPAQPALLP